MKTMATTSSENSSPPVVELAPAAQGAHVFQELFFAPCDLFVLTSRFGPRCCVRDHVLADSEAAAVACGVRDAAPLTKARLGSSSPRANADDRGDFIAWLSHEYATSTEAPALRPLFDLVRHRIVPQLAIAFPSVASTRISVQLAKYDHGARYVRHADCNHESKRVVTLVYYLNPGWRIQDEGRLRMYYSDWTSFAEAHCDVAPVLNRLVVFPSDVEHEVLVSQATSRYAITFWLHRDTDEPTRSLASPPRLDILPAPSAPSQHNERRPVMPGWIHVSIAAYNDADVANTIADAFAKAARADMVTVGVCWQGDCAPPAVDKAWVRRVRWLLLPSSDAKGPCPARRLALGELLRDEEFVLQIDAHMRFAEGWDAYFVSQIAQCASRKPVLSTYPSGLDAQGQEPPRGSPLLCATGFDDDGMLRLASKRLAHPMEHARPSLFWAAGFSFSRAEAFKVDVEYPAIDDLFFGEEVLVAAALWTRGWDFFCPGGEREYIFHQWKRTSEWRPAKRSDALAAYRRAFAALADDPNAVRPLSDFERHCGVDFKERVVSERARCGGLASSDELAGTLPLGIAKVNDLLAAFLG